MPPITRSTTRKLENELTKIAIYSTEPAKKSTSLLKFKKLSPTAFSPHRHETSAGIDLYCPMNVTAIIEPYSKIELDTKIAVEIPKGHMGQLWTKSSMARCDIDIRGKL